MKYLKLFQIVFDPRSDSNLCFSLQPLTDSNLPNVYSRDTFTSITAPYKDPDAPEIHKPHTQHGCSLKVSRFNVFTTTHTVYLLCRQPQTVTNLISTGVVFSRHRTDWKPGGTAWTCLRHSWVFFPVAKRFATVRPNEYDPGDVKATYS